MAALITATGLLVVYGEVEAVKTGYRIRRQNLRKSELVTEMKGLESEIASLKTPRRLEEWLTDSRMTLTQSRPQRLVRAEKPRRVSGGSKGGPARFAQLFLGTARADSER